MVKKLYQKGRNVETHDWREMGQFRPGVAKTIESPNLFRGGKGEANGKGGNYTQ